MTEPAILAKTLRGLREQAGLSQTGLAAKAGLSVSYINDLERGRKLRPSPPVRARLAKALRCPIGRLAQ
jgi:transcriptional regulator with XRE-family HTH domain